MSKRDELVCLNDMLSHSREAVQFLGTAKPEDLKANRMLQLALTRLIEIVGEAAKRIPESDQKNTQRFPGHKSWACATAWFTVTT